MRIRIASLGFALASILVIAGCGSTVTKVAAAPTATPTATPTSVPTAAPTVVPTTTPNPRLKVTAQLCSKTETPAATVGDLWIFGGKNATFNPYGDPSIMGSAMLNTHPPVTKPYAIGYQTSMDYTKKTHALAELDQGEELQFDICNSSKTAAHVIQGVGLQIALFNPYTSTRLDVWQGGCDPAYPIAADGCSCGGYAQGPTEEFSTTWPANIETGTILLLNQTATDIDPSPTSMSPQYGSVPFTLPPGHAVTIEIMVSAPPQHGTYLLNPSLKVDGSMIFFQNTLNPVVLAPATQVWSGEACMKAAMKSQIPANTKSLWICPNS